MANWLLTSRVNLRRAISPLLGGLMAILSTSAYSASCAVHSGAGRATLIELFTSEGCSSCPPAERWLSGFVGKSALNSEVVPLAFHVDYWDYLGWRDRFASPRYTARQAERVGRTRGRFAYTPQTLVNGFDSSAWRQARSPGDLAPVAPGAPGADLVLQVDSAPAGQIKVELDAKLRQVGDSGRAVAYLALYENGLSSRVRAGENAGRQLRHDFVVRDWAGPFEIQGKKINHVFAAADLAYENAGVAAVVEKTDGGSLLQAVAQALCQ